MQRRSVIAEEQNKSVSRIRPSSRFIHEGDRFTARRNALAVTQGRSLFLAPVSVYMRDKMKYSQSREPVRGKQHAEDKTCLKVLFNTLVCPPVIEILFGLCKITSYYKSSSDNRRRHSSHTVWRPTVTSGASWGLNPRPSDLLYCINALI